MQSVSGAVSDVADVSDAAHAVDCNIHANNAKRRRSSPFITWTPSLEPSSEHLDHLNHNYKRHKHNNYKERTNNKIFLESRKRHPISQYHLSLCNFAKKKLIDKAVQQALNIRLKKRYKQEQLKQHQRTQLFTEQLKQLDSTELNGILEPIDSVYSGDSIDSIDSLSILDLGCGIGGDINKVMYAHTNIAIIVGVDSVWERLVEARNRFESRWKKPSFSFSSPSAPSLSKSSSSSSSSTSSSTSSSSLSLLSASTSSSLSSSLSSSPSASTSVAQPNAPESELSELSTPVDPDPEPVGPEAFWFAAEMQTPQLVQKLWQGAKDRPVFNIILLHFSMHYCAGSAEEFSNLLDNISDAADGVDGCVVSVVIMNSLEIKKLMLVQEQEQEQEQEQKEQREEKQERKEQQEKKQEQQQEQRQVKQERKQGPVASAPPVSSVSSVPSVPSIEKVQSVQSAPQTVTFKLYANPLNPDTNFFSIEADKDRLRGWNNTGSKYSTGTPIRVSVGLPHARNVDNVQEFLIEPELLMGEMKKRGFSVMRGFPCSLLQLCQWNKRNKSKRKCKSKSPMSSKTSKSREKPKEKGKRKEEQEGASQKKKRREEKEQFENVYGLGKQEEVEKLGLEKEEEKEWRTFASKQNPAVRLGLKDDLNSSSRYALDLFSHVHACFLFCKE